jgi:hypothetical protein
MTEQTYYRHLTNINPTPVLEELVKLASNHTGLGAEYRLGGQTYVEMDWCDAAEAHENGYAEDPTIGAIFCTEAPGINMSPFWDELRRLEKLIKTPLREPILDDDHPMTGGYTYVVDGHPTMNPWMRHSVHDRPITVAEFKQLERANEVCECDLIGRNHRFPEMKMPAQKFQPGWNEAGTHMRQAKRRPRSSNKIKKAMKNGR